MKLTQGTKIVMTGDSITDCERRPIAEGAFGGLGNGYVSLVDALLTTVYPDYGIRIVNTGISGNTVRDLKARWQSDVLDLNPDWVSVMIGINDVWRQFDYPLMSDKHVLIHEYEDTLTELVQRTLPTVQGMILMTPFYIEPNRDDAMRAKMDEYGAVVRRLAEQFGCLFVDTQAAFDELTRHYHPSAIAGDRVHPSRTGHMVIARAWLDALGFDYNRKA